MTSHHEGETWGLEVVETKDGENLLFTIGDDNKILMFDFEAKKFI